MRKTKNIATLGPASSNKNILCKLLNAGVNVVRINMSHISQDSDVESLVSLIRDCEMKTKKRVGILIDLCGPKIRVAKNIPENIKIIKDELYTLGMGDVQIPLGIKIKFNEVGSYSSVKIDDGKISFKVEEKKKQQKAASATELMDQITELEKQMFEFARELEFEKAASLRDDIEALRKQVVTLS